MRVLFLALLLAGFAPAAQGQTVVIVSGAQSLLLDPSVRSSGMGLSSNAVFWGDAPNDWANPALLAYRHGMGYEWGRTQLIPDLADDVFFTTKRFTFGAWGAGILVAGKPIGGIGSVKLDYGRSIAVDPDGNVLFAFSSFEETRVFAAGVNLLEFGRHALHKVGREIPDLTRYGDLAIGWSAKRTHVALVPADLVPGGEGFVTTHDSGVLARLTPYDGIDHVGRFPRVDRLAGLRVDLSYGGSTQNYNNASVEFIGTDQMDPIVRFQIKGWAARAAVDLPRWRKDVIRSGKRGWLLDVVTPVLSIGKSGTKQVPLVPDAEHNLAFAGDRIRNSGWEVTIANIYSIRRGKIDDPTATIQGKTKGWGIGLRLKGTVGISYDRATVPQPFGLRPVRRKAISFQIQPLNAWKLVHRVKK